jgi:Ca2+-dependent lipid-binding protein
MSNELGTLVIVVLKAQNLNDIHSFSKQDAYGQISLNGTVKRTPVDKRAGQHPMWDAEIRFPIMKDKSEKHRMLEVSCWADEPRDDVLLGQAKLDISETLKTGEFDGESAHI